MPLPTQPAISVILPVYNAERFVGEAVESILQQTFGDFELLLLDDGSTDGTGAILERYACDPRVRVIHQANAGLIATLNRGLAEARGLLIARMDADDISLPDRFARQVAFLESHPRVAVVGGAARCIKEDGEFVNALDWSTWPAGLHHPCEPADVRKAMENYSALVHPAVLMRREAVREVGGYRSAFVAAEDYDLWLRLADRHDLANLNDVVLLYRLHPNQVSAQKCLQQSISTRGAQLSAKVRRAGLGDPAERAGMMSVEQLVKMGMLLGEGDQVFAELMKQSLFAPGDRSAFAKELSGELYRVLIKYGGRAKQAEFAWMTARVLRQQKHYWSALCWMTQSFRAAPKAALRLLARTKIVQFA